MAADPDDDDWTVPTAGQRVFADTWGPALDNAVRITLADGTAAVATLHRDGTVRLSDPGDGTPVRQPLPVTATWGPFDELTVRRDAAGHPQLGVATGREDWGDLVALVWDASTGRRVRALSGDARVASGHQQSPDVLLWDVATGQQHSAIATGDPNGVSALAVLPGSAGTEVLASGHYAGSTIRWWNARSGEPVHEHADAHAGGVWDLCAVRLPDGRTLLASAGDGGAVRL
jgi:WD40 repeat protein